MLSASLTSVAFSKAFDFIHCGKLIALYVEEASLVTLLCLTWRNIKGFLVSGVMIVNRLWLSERLTSMQGPGP